VQQGTRPVLVASPGAFHQFTKTSIVLPVASGGDFARAAGFAASLAAAGARATVAAAAALTPSRNRRQWRRPSTSS